MNLKYILKGNIVRICGLSVCWQRIILLSGSSLWKKIISTFNQIYSLNTLHHYLQFLKKWKRYVLAPAESSTHPKPYSFGYYPCTERNENKESKYLSNLRRFLRVQIFCQFVIKRMRDVTLIVCSRFRIYIIFENRRIIITSQWKDKTTKS